MLIQIHRNYQELEKIVKFKENIREIHRLSELSAQQKFEWANFKRLQANQLFKKSKIHEAIEIYIQSLTGFDFTSQSQQVIKQVKQQSMYVTILNIVTCFYKIKQFDESLKLCDMILMQCRYYPCLFKKASVLIQMGQLQQAKIYIEQMEIQTDPKSKNDCDSLNKLVKQKLLKENPNTPENKVKQQSLNIINHDQTKSKLSQIVEENIKIWEIIETAKKRMVL